MFTVNINADGSSFNYTTDSERDMLMQLERCIVAFYHGGYDKSTYETFVAELIKNLCLYDKSYIGLSFEEIIMKNVL